MEEFGKINSLQLYKLWKNLTIGMVTVIAMMTFTKLLPYYFSPIVSLLCAAFLYVYIYENKVRREIVCLIIPLVMFYCLISYAFVTVLLNILYAWGFKQIPLEFIFFGNSFIPSLIMNPICFITFVIVYLRHDKISICVDCKIHNGGEKLYKTALLRHESRFQMKNLIAIFGILSAIVWTYYLEFYVKINLNSRDWYIFTWLTIIFFILDELYFITRYYNLYLDLKENDEIITPEELQNMTSKTYLRYYVICGNNIYVDAHAIDPKSPYKEVIDTPFFTKRNVNGIPVAEVKKIIRNMTGVDGELRFFYGRRTDSTGKTSILRYFYFLDEVDGVCPAITTQGEWMDYEKIKYLYSNNPGRLAEISVTDTTRLATILLTEKIFNEKGYRKSKIKIYNPSFNLHDVRKSNLDFQDDKWIEISLFNSDTPFYSIKRKWRKLMQKNKKTNSWG